MTREPDSYYEPSPEDFAWMIAREKDLTSLRSEYHEAGRELRDYGAHTDRQLRGLNKKKKACKRILGRRHQFDVVSDSFDVLGDDLEPIGTFLYCETIGDEDDYRGPEPLNRKDKRRAKTERRKAEKNLRIWRTQWEKSHAASVVRKTGALVSAVAADWHAERVA